MSLRRVVGAAALLARAAEHQARSANVSQLVLSRASPEPALAALLQRGNAFGGQGSFFSSGSRQQQQQQQQQGGAAESAAADAAARAEAGASAEAGAEAGPSSSGGAGPLPGDGLSPEELQAALAEAQAQLEAESKKAEEMRERLLRTLADMENLRERTARQAAEARQYATQGLVKSIIEVADNLERAAGSVPPGELEAGADVDADRALSLLRSLRDGVLLTDSILMKVLAKEGVTRYDPLGQPFDPNLHSALFEVPDATKAPGTVAVVIKKGYALHDRAVRAAEVGVARAAAE